MVRGKFPDDRDPMGAVVTASGTGAEMNAGSVITCEEKCGRDRSFGTAASFCRSWIRPYTMTVPKMQVLSAHLTLGHAMKHISRTSDQDNVSDDVALAVMEIQLSNIRRVLVDINDIRARGNLMWDSAMAEMES